MRQARNYGALHETHREAEETQPSRTESREPRDYGAVRQTQWQLDEQQRSRAEAPARPTIVRRWTHHGGMEEHQRSANDWIKQNHKLRMSDNSKGRGGETPSPDRQQNDAELQQARAAVEEARRREADRRARQQERERGGPER